MLKKIWLSTCLDNFVNEYDDIEAMFRQGLSRLILNKKGDPERWLLSLSMEYREKIWLRGSPDAALNLDLRGCVADSYVFTQSAVSESWKRLSCIAFCRTLDELDNLPAWLGGALVGPVFPSLSAVPGAGMDKSLCFDKLSIKLQDYSAQKDSVPLILWGGIDKDVLEKLSDLPISGVSLLGGVWNYADPVNAFIKFKRTFNHY
ncbi:MAG: hypothetical protein HUK21_08075 [Fibrobacteraceae bacterium]|nr:hypothetical protein [Fibrobacteraceae bacterium]